MFKKELVYIISSELGRQLETFTSGSLYQQILGTAVLATVSNACPTDASVETHTDPVTNVLGTKHPNDVHADTVDTDLNVQKDNVGVVTRYGRQIKTPTRMDL